MTTFYSKSLAQIVNENHKAAYVFEKYHLDFCCKGKRLLEQACDEGGVSIHRVISDLENVTGDVKISIDFDKMSVAQLSDYIVLTHHNYVKKEIPLISSYLARVVSKHGEKHPEMAAVSKAFAELGEDMTGHMEKEEVILFPRIKMIDFYGHNNNEVQINRSYLETPIAIMEQEHENAGDILSQIRELADNYHLPADACTTYRLAFASLQAFEMDLHHHIHLENNILFPKTIRLFNTLNDPFLNQN